LWLTDMHRTTGGVSEYLVKWEDLPYADCTWETAQGLCVVFKRGTDGIFVFGRAVWLVGLFGC
jgi:hypothetical protein